MLGVSGSSTNIDSQEESLKSSYGFSDTSEQPVEVAHGETLDLTMTPEESFLSAVLSPDDVMELVNDSQEKELYDLALAHLSEQQRMDLALWDALDTLFYDIRQRSLEGFLTTPDYWLAVGLVPDSIDPQEFEDKVLAIVFNKQRLDVVSRSTPLSDTETCESVALPDKDNQDLDPKLQEMIKNLTTQPVWDTSDIKVLQGSSLYLYSELSMTDNFAHWAFLAAEDNDVVTLVDNVRTESKIYPRPMIIDSLSNKPYYFSKDRIFRAYEDAVKQHQYSDIKQCSASNGDIYFYSTRYLSTPQAQALAEWFSVEMKVNL